MICIQYVKDETWSMMSKNYFVENNRTTSVMISKDRVNYEEFNTGKYIDFFPEFHMFICKCRSGSVFMQAFGHNSCLMNWKPIKWPKSERWVFLNTRLLFDVIRIQERLCLFCKECDWKLWPRMIFWCWGLLQLFWVLWDKWIT